MSRSTRSCANCGRSLKGQRRDAVYCSAACRNSDWKRARKDDGLADAAPAPTRPTAEELDAAVWRAARQGRAWAIEEVRRQIAAEEREAEPTLTQEELVARFNRG